MHIDKNNHELTWAEFEKVDIRIGTVLSAVPFEKARKPAYLLAVDFGPLGVLKTSAQITKLYEPADLPGRQVVAVVNFPPKQIANMMSQCLILGGLGDEGEVTLLVTERPVPPGTKIG